tara:strand:- start:15235 stop:16920 length:1686 start_codon:yes stop_codon:yes gene_type:complete
VTERPANLPHGRWLGDLEAERSLSAFEKALVAACAAGKPCTPEGWNGTRPAVDAASETNSVRADLIRFLALGGDSDHPVHEEGVKLHGGYISGTLSLHQARATVKLDLKQCYFVTKPVLTLAQLPELALSGSKVPGIHAEGMVVRSGVFLSHGFEATGEVRLLGAQIGGNLQCSKCKFTNKDGIALGADGMVVKGSMFMRDGFEATGLVRLVGAQIAGNLSCKNSKFINKDRIALGTDRMVVKGSVFLDDGFEAIGEVRLPGAQIGGDLACSNGKFANKDSVALSANGISVMGGMFLRDATIIGAVDLTAAKIGTLVDDVNCWQSGGHLFDGLHYDRIIGPTDAASRINWLETQQPDQLGEDFKPQPWEQLIKVLRDMGHPNEAAEVAMAKQRALRKAGVIKGWPRKALHSLYGGLAGYGHRPIWTAGWMVLVCCLCSLAYYCGRIDGLFGPTSPIIQTSPALVACGDGGTMDRIYWTDSQNCPMPPEYTTFQPFFYSLDLILPLVDLQQERDWSPIVTNEKGETLWGGRLLRWFMWFEILFGWMASLMLVAVLGRLVDKD